MNSARHTLEVILKKSGLQVSKLEDLANETVLYLPGTQITDLTPLSALVNLTALDLSQNQITDLTPLSALVNLTALDLRQNQITNLTPLSALINLECLFLVNNQITDLTPLSALNNLKELYLSNNKISNVTPLSALTNLKWLSLSSNQIIDLSPLNTFTELKIKLNGVNFSQKYWVQKEQWSAQWLLEEVNSEVRRVLVQVMGYEKICLELEAIELDKLREYFLLKIALNVENEEDIYLLKMTCASTGYIHFLRVPPEVNSCREALLWINWGIDLEDFAIET